MSILWKLLRAHLKDSKHELTATWPEKLGNHWKQSTIPYDLMEMSGQNTKTSNEEQLWEWWDESTRHWSARQCTESQMLPTSNKQIKTLQERFTRIAVPIAMTQLVYNACTGVWYGQPHNDFRWEDFGMLPVI